MSFLKWLMSCEIYVGNCRYGQFGGWGFVCVADFDLIHNLKDIVGNLSGGDQEALEAERKIKKITDDWEWDKDPSVAMSALIDKLKTIHKNLPN